MPRTITADEMRSLISTDSRKLLDRLVKSEFYAPFDMESNSLMVNTVSDDESTFVRLFASKEDYERIENEIKPIKIRFDIIHHILRSSVDGFIVYCNSQEFILDSDFLKRNVTPFTPEELKEISDNLDDDSQSLEDGIFLSLLLSEDDYSNNATDGIITHTPDISLNMATTDIGGKFFHLLFTSKEHLKNALKLFPGDHYYSQIIDISDLIRYFMENETEGILIDFPDELKYVSTENLMEMDIKENLKLRNSLEILFEV